MKHSRFALLALLTCAPLLLRAQPAQPPPLTAAVLDFQTGDDLKEKGSDLAALLNVQLSVAAPDVIWVERQEIEKIFAEEELGASGTVTPDTAARLGQLTGAKVLITGRLFNTGDKSSMIAKVISTETGRVYAELATFNDPSTLDKAVAELAGKVAVDLKSHADTLVAKVEDPAARLDRLRGLVGGHKPLPSVSVVIPEQHIRAFVIDPAAQTEIKLILQQLGFEVINPQPGNRQADIQIGGEAFSEYAGRHGNLVSCRARVEIRMSRPGNSTLLLADRETAVAVDLAEDMAGKAALEDASAKLLDRIVPKLISPQ